MAIAAKPGTSLLCSGFLDTDIELIETEAQRVGFMMSGEIASERWRCLHFVKN
jgi:ribosomal protein L11 methylase PrmA